MMKRNESDAGHRIAVTQNGHADALPPDVPLRAGDAIHTATALETGETEIWTNDRHLLAAVAHFGLAGRSFATIR
jgi:predicted nucleic acid-binding protein